METKQYSIEVGGCLEDGWIVLFEGFFHAEFRDEQDAKEYVEFKNRKKIDKNVKEGIINRLEELRCEAHSVEMKEGFSEERICSTEFANAIKIIKTLSDGE